MAEVWGRVVALQANFYAVVPDPFSLPSGGGAGSGDPDSGRLLCTRRSRLDHAGFQVCVGDRVRLEGVDSLAGRAAVAAVAPRINLLRRPPVANVNRVLVVASLAEPALDPQQLSRFLLSAEACGATAVELVLSKADLLPPTSLAAWQERFASWGYGAKAVSTRSGEGLEALRRGLAHAEGIGVLCGPSGAGKSSLIKALRPDLELRVAPVSGRLRRGRHTTRHVELFPLASGMLLADTPGFNRPELPTDPARLASLFPELRARLEAGACRFRNCRHLGDPGCAAGTDWSRFLDYRQCLEELDQGASPMPRRNRGTPARISRRGREG